MFWQVPSCGNLVKRCGNAVDAVVEVARKRSAKVVELDFLGVDKGRVATVRLDVVFAHQTHGSVHLSVEDVDELGYAILSVDVGEVEWGQHRQQSRQAR